MECNMDCLNCVYDDCINTSPIKKSEYNSEIATGDEKRLHRNLMMKEYARKKKNELRSKGLCVVCGLVPPQKGFDCCKECAIKRNQKSTEFRQRRKAAGLCVCGNPLQKGKKRCKECYEAAKIYQSERYAKRTELHQCVVCGADLGDEMLKICESCRIKRKNAKAKRKGATMK